MIVHLQDRKKLSADISQVAKVMEGIGAELYFEMADGKAYKIKYKHRRMAKEDFEFLQDAIERYGKEQQEKK